MSEHGEYESHAGITAEIRARAGAWMDDKLKQYDERLADRLEAAHKREVATTKESLAVGNSGDCAKLREALCEILSYIESFHKYITPGKGKKLTALFAVADTIRGKARAALAEPPRNCERFQTKDAAREAFQKLRGHRVMADVSLWDDRDEIEAFLDWLFALGKEGSVE